MIDRTEPFGWISFYGTIRESNDDCAQFSHLVERELSSVNPAIPMDPSEFSRNAIRGRLSDARERMTDMTEMIHSISFFVVGINRWRRKCVFRHVN